MGVVVGWAHGRAGRAIQPQRAGWALPDASGSRLARTVNVQNDDPDDVFGCTVYLQLIDNAVRSARQYAGAGHVAGASRIGVVGEACDCGDDGPYAPRGRGTRSGLAIPTFDVSQAFGREFRQANRRMGYRRRPMKCCAGWAMGGGLAYPSFPPTPVYRPVGSPCPRPLPALHAQYAAPRALGAGPREHPELMIRSLHPASPSLDCGTRGDAAPDLYGRRAGGTRLLVPPCRRPRIPLLCMRTTRRCGAGLLDASMPLV